MTVSPSFPFLFPALNPLRTATLICNATGAAAPVGVVRVIMADVQHAGCGRVFLLSLHYVRYGQHEEPFGGKAAARAGENVTVITHTPAACASQRTAATLLPGTPCCRYPTALRYAGTPAHTQQAATRHATDRP